MDLKLTDEAAFWAEYQNDPLPEDLGTEEQLTVDGIVNNLNGHSQRGVPVSANHITMFIDVQKTLLFYVVCAWDDDFTGRVIDYGTWPDQRRRYFALADANPTLQRKFPHTGLEGCLYGGLKALPHRRELGSVDRGRVPILPGGKVRKRDPAEPRQVHRRVLQAHERVQEDGRRPRRT